MKRSEKIDRKIEYGLMDNGPSSATLAEIYKLLSFGDPTLIQESAKDIRSLFDQTDLKGLDLARPVELEGIGFLDGATHEAKKAGTINTIKVQKGKLIGFNTDYYGFKKLLIKKRIYVKGKKCLILVDNGSVGYIKMALQSLGAAEINAVKLKADKTFENIEGFLDHEILINTTSVGAYPDNGSLVIALDPFKSLEGVVDLISDPFNSRLVLEAKRRKIRASGGLLMTVYRAKRSLEIFMETKIPDHKADQAFRTLVDHRRNIILVGMPGSGKTSISRKLAQRLGKEHVDTDKEFLKVYGRTPGEMIEAQGEAAFRVLESRLAEEIGKRQCLVISTSGGMVTKDENYYHLKQNGPVILIERDLAKLSTKNRILSRGGMPTLITMKKKRRANYELFSNIKVTNNRSFRYCLEEIVNILREDINDLWL